MARGVRARVYDALTSFFGVSKAGRGKLKTGEPQLAGWNGPYHGTPGAWAGEAARQVSEYQGWVYTAVNFIATQVSACPPCAVRVLPPGTQAKAYRAEKAWRLGRGDEPPLRSFVPSYVAKSASGTKPYAEEYEYLPPDNPLQSLLSDPNEPFTGYDLWYLAQVYLELTGSAYLYKHRDGSGRVTELWNMPSQWVNPCGEGKERLIDFYELNPNTRMSGSYEGGTRIEFDDIIRIRKPSPFNLIAGYSPVQSNAAEIDTYKQVTAVRYLSLQNGMSVGAVLQSEAGAEELSTEAINRIEARLAGHYGGVFNSGRTLVLNKGWKWEFPPAGRELEFIQTQDQLRKHILAGFGIDESHLMSAEATYAAAIDNRRKVRMDVVDPRLKMFSSTLSERLAKDEFGDEYRIIYPDIPQETPQEKKDRLELLASKNAITTNELRSEYGMEPREEPEADQLMGDAAAMPLGADAAAWDGGGELMQGDMGIDDAADDDSEESHPVQDDIINAVLDSLGVTTDKAIGDSAKPKKPGKSGVFTDRAGRKYRLQNGKRVPLGNNGEAGKAEGLSPKSDAAHGKATAKLAAHADKLAVKHGEDKKAQSAASTTDWAAKTQPHAAVVAAKLGIDEAEAHQLLTRMATTLAGAMQASGAASGTIRDRKTGQTLRLDKKPKTEKPSETAAKDEPAKTDAEAKTEPKKPESANADAAKKPANDGWKTPAKSPDEVTGVPKTKKERRELASSLNGRLSETTNQIVEQQGKDEDGYAKMTPEQVQLSNRIFFNLEVIQTGKERDGVHDLGPVNDRRYAGYYRGIHEDLDKLRASIGKKDATSSKAINGIAEDEMTDDELALLFKEFSESKHPRDASGQFASGTGSQSFKRVEYATMDQFQKADYHEIASLKKGDVVRVGGHGYAVVSVKTQVRTTPVFHPTDPSSTWQGEKKTPVTTVKLMNSAWQVSSHTFRGPSTEDKPPNA